MPNQIRRAARAGTTAWWTNAILAGSVTPDEAVSHVRGDVLLPSRTWASSGSRSLSADSGRSPWPVTWGWLRGQDCPGVRLVLPVPGDPLGMTATADTTSLAIDSGCALICDRASVALIPQESGLWQVRRAEPGLPDGGLGTIAEARRSMREAMAEFSRVFAAINPDETDLAKIQTTRRSRAPTAPRGVDPRAAQLVASASQVWQFVEIAIDASYRRGEVPRELVALNHNARRALAVAFSHPIANGATGRPLPQ